MNAKVRYVPLTPPRTFATRRARVSAVLASTTCRTHSLRRDAALASNALRNPAASSVTAKSCGTSTKRGAVSKVSTVLNCASTKIHPVLHLPKPRQALRPVKPSRAMAQTFH